MKRAGLTMNKIAQDNPTVWTALLELDQALQKLYDGHAPAVLLYGSYARGEASEASDVDVILLYPKAVQPGKEISQLRAVLSALNLRYQILISVLPVSSQQFQNNDSTFWKNVRREAVAVGSP